MLQLRSCWPTLLGAGLVEISKQALSLSPELNVLATAATPLLAVAGSLFPNLATNQIADAAKADYAQRNHHLRLGMAAALRRGLAAARATLRVDSDRPAFVARFELWDRNLAQAEDRAILDRFIPELLEEDLFIASSGAPRKDEGAEALAILLFNCLTTDPHLSSSWTPAEALELGRQVLPYYFEEFKQQAIKDDQSHLFQAFTVNGINRLLAQGHAEAEKTRLHMTAEANRILQGLPAPRSVIPQDWRAPTIFLGREVELRMLAALLLRPTPSSVFVASIQGLPGVGKSLLCEQFAAQHQAHFPGGYARLTLNPDTHVTGDQLLQQLAERYALKAPDAELASVLRSHLSQPRALIHIENVDGDAAAKAVSELARKISGCALMVSGRRGGLGLGQGWQQVLVEPFTPAQAFEQLEAELGRPARNAAERDEWQHLLTRCGFLPLAVHLSAGQLRAGLSVAELLAELLTLVPVDPADPLYEQSARACLQTSFEISWRLFERQSAEKHKPGWPNALSAFSAAPLNAIGIGLAAAICDLPPTECNRMLVDAANLSLVVRESADPSRWRLHALLQEFLAAKTPGTHAEGAVRQNKWFLERLPERSGVEERTLAWNEIRDEEEALTAWLGGLDPMGAQAAVSAGSQFANQRGPWRAWLRTSECGLENGEVFDGWANSGYLAANVARQLGDLDASLRFASLNAKQAKQNDEKYWYALAVGQIADILMARGDLDEALRIRQQEELPVYEKLGDIRSKAITQGQIADILMARGDLDESLRIRQQEESPVYEKLGDIHSKAITQGKIADILMARGDLDEALRILQQEQLPVYEKLGDIRSKAITQGKIADILMARGDLDEALRIRQQEQLPVYEKLGDIRSKAITQGKIADILMARGDLDEALRIRQQEESPVYEKLGDIHSKAITQGQIAMAFAQKGDLLGGCSFIEAEVIPILKRLGDRRELLMIKANLAMIKRGLGKQAEARALLNEALAEAQALRLPVADQIRNLLES